MDVFLTYVCYNAFAEKSIKVGKAKTPDFNISINPKCFMLEETNKNPVNMPFLTFSYHF